MPAGTKEAVHRSDERGVVTDVGDDAERHHRIEHPYARLLAIDRLGILHVDVGDRLGVEATGLHVRLRGAHHLR